VGTTILDEFPEPAGGVLWQTLRDVHLWVRAAPAERTGLFSGDALRGRLAMLMAHLVDPDLRAPLVRLGFLLLGKPAKAEAKRVAAECRRVVEWAERRAALGTALAFAQAAALAAPADAALALETGILAVARGEEARAESWLRRALVLARREGDRSAHARACLELGDLYAGRDSVLLARGFYLRALGQGRRKGRWEVRGAALRGLSQLTEAHGDPAEEHGTSRSGALS